MRSPTPSGDSTLASSAPAGSPSAFERLYREHFDFVLANLRRLGVPSAQLEDAAQDVFVVAYRRLDDFEGRSSERTWLYGIARRIAHRHRRTVDRTNRRRQRLARASPDRAIDVEHEVDRRRAGQLLHVFLDTLPADQRDAFILGELEQLGRQEVGAALGISPNTAYSRLRLARERLCRTFDDSERRHELIMRWREPPRSSPERRRRVMALVLARMPERGAGAGIVGSSSISAWVAAGAVALGAVGVMLVVRTQLPEPAVSDAPRMQRVASDRGSRAIHGGEDEPVPSVEPPAVAVPPRPAAATPRPRPEPPRAPSRRGPRPDGAGSPSDEAAPGDLAAELSALQRARHALTRDDAPAALRLLRAHAERFPETAFALDRRVLEIEARCRSGDLDSGRAARRRFLQEHGSSPQAARVRELCTTS